MVPVPALGGAIALRARVFRILVACRREEKVWLYLVVEIIVAILEGSLREVLGEGD